MKKQKTETKHLVLRLSVKKPFYCLVYGCASEEKIGDHEQENKTIFFAGEKK